MLAVALLVPAAWLLGTFPSATLVGRAHGRDITAEGSGNPGASNAMRVLGWRAGLVVLLIDIGKGAIAAGVGLAVGGRVGAVVLGAAAVLGHTFPLYRRGGKGIATAGGALLVLYPFIALPLAAVWFVVARVLHKASLASLLCAAVFPVAVWAFGYAAWEVAATGAISLFLIARHAGNIRRLLRRQELGLERT